MVCMSFYTSIWQQFSSVQFRSHQFVWKARSVQFSSAVPHKKVVIVTGATVIAPERFKLRGSLIKYLPLHHKYSVNVPKQHVVLLRIEWRTLWSRFRFYLNNPF